MKNIVFCTFLVAYSGVITAGLQFDCDKIKSFYNSLKYSGSDTGSFLSARDIRERFSKVKQFTSGKGGASVYWVKDLEVDRVLKIFPAESFEKDFEKNNEIREIFFSCHLAKEKFTLPNATFSSTDTSFFPRFFGFAYTDSDTPFDQPPPVQSSKKHLMMVMEFIKGKDMFVHSEEKASDSPLLNKAQSQAIILQIVSALEQAHKNLGFYHLDLHPGNIVLSSDKTVKFRKASGAYVIAPMVKIIDFGLATGSYFYVSDGLDPRKAASLTLSPSRNYSLALLNFSTNLRGSLIYSAGFISKAKSVSEDYPGGDDLQFVNMMIYTFRNTFSSFNNYCQNYQKCIQDFSKFE